MKQNRPKMKLSPKRIIAKNAVIFLVSCLLSEFLTGCAADLSLNSSSSSSTNSVQDQNTRAGLLIGAKVNFHFGDFYSLVDPNPTTSCAGDAKNFYDPLTLSSSTPLKLEASVLDSSTTIRPSFIKNVSVNLTDANAPLDSNNAKSCSLGSGIGSPLVSNCSTFDFGAIGGIPTNMGGTLLLIGGLQSTNFNGIQSDFTPSHGLTVSCGPALSPVVLGTSSSDGYNVCGADVFGLGLGTLPSSAAGTTFAPGLTSSDVPISTWSHISAKTGYTGPRGAAGSSASLDEGLSRVLLFAGAAPLAGMSSVGFGSLTSDTWVFDVKTQKWGQVTTSPSIDQTIQRQFDTTLAGGTGSQFLQVLKNPGGRALFGYVAVPGASLSGLSSDGTVASSLIDTTDRIFLIGGVGSCPFGTCTDVRRFNPTFGPEYFDVAAPLDAIATTPAVNLNEKFVQWIDSSPDQIVSNGFDAETNTTTNSQYFPSAFPSPTPTPTATTSSAGATTFLGSSIASAIPPRSSVNFGAVALSNNSAGSLGQGPVNPGATAPFTTTGIPGSGYLAVAGGFYGYSGTPGIGNVSNATQCTSGVTNCGGDLQIGKKRGSHASERRASNFGQAANHLDVLGSENTPIEWKHIADPTITTGTPWFGGAVMLKGINIFSSAFNEMVYVGGSNCKGYLTGSSLCPSSVANPGQYWTFGLDPSANLTFPNITSMTGTIPTNAGMAAARGNDLNNNPLIVAMGGVSSPGVFDTSGTIYYLYNNSSTPRWGTFTVPAGTGPQSLANASMVYSHVTGKFYFHGGFHPTKGSASETWELNVSNQTPGCGLATSDSCQFTWRLLDTTAGLTCYPNCPSARRSHKMVEANYHYFNSPNDPVCTVAGHPCSFGIFMTGGTPDGITTIADRWMFDPTANNGNGHWQQVDSFPPRTLAAMASVDYFSPQTQTVLHRAIVFGGETGMENPLAANGQTNGFFVAPTLGDTWMFDYDNPSWNRVQLLGQRVSGTYTLASSLSETQARATSFVSGTLTLSPPPLSGAMMVTRTVLRANHSTSDSPKPLAIPEIFLFGGRTKDGFFHSFDHVYKFCAGSTGEKPYPTVFNGTSTSSTTDDASCDAFDGTENPASQSPQAGYVGRWLEKTPVGSIPLPIPSPTPTSTPTPSQESSFMGAAVYDNSRDIILTYGGIVGTTGTLGAVTDSSSRGVSSTSNVLGSILEYTPPSKASSSATTDEKNGTWARVKACQESPSVPVGRYGHSMAFDSLHRKAFIVGGYKLDGDLLTQSYPQDTSIQTPEIWSATRIDAADAVGIASEGIPPITLGDASSNFPCYYWASVSVFGNSPSDAINGPPTTGIAHAASVYIAASGYNTGYYTMLDSACVNSGPIISTDSAINKLLIGGAYIDIDRSQLGANENLILNLTFLPLGVTNNAPDQSLFKTNESAVFKVHLMRTGQSGDIIRQVPQPRDLTYASEELFPQVAESIAVIAPPTGQIRQEQVFIPLGFDPTIDRIRIERHSGSGILIDATVFRAGNK